MNNPNFVTLSPLEWKVMRIVCELESCAARDVYQITKEKFNMHPGTTRTLLRRLVDKGHLTTKQIGNCYVYEPKAPLIDSVMNEANIICEHALDGDASPLILHMVKKGKLTHEDLEELRSLIHEQEQKNRKKKR